MCLLSQVLPAEKQRKSYLQLDFHFWQYLYFLDISVLLEYNKNIWSVQVQ